MPYTAPTAKQVINQFSQKSQVLRSIAWRDNIPNFIQINQEIYTLQVQIHLCPAVEHDCYLKNADNNQFQKLLEA